jgi:endonuclease/exonuclease/phosphatase family metal-dependent hydrolase
MAGLPPEIVTGEFAPPRLDLWPPRSVRVLDWNIDRGLHLASIIDFLSSSGADLLLLQEVDMNARRTHRLNIAEEIARALQMSYVFAREFQELLEGSSQSPAYHGQATLSRWRLKNARLIRFRSQSHFWRPHWFVPHIHPFQVRLGGRIALVAEAVNTGRKLVTYNLHLESRGPDSLRIDQLAETLSNASRYDPGTPLLVAGDLNLNASTPDAAALVQRYGLRNAAGSARRPTAHRHLFVAGRPIDWAFVRGPIQAERAKVHSSVRASDHYPVSFTLTF